MQQLRERVDFVKMFSYDPQLSTSIMKTLV